MNPVVNWFKRNLSNPQVVILVMLVLLGLFAVIFMAKILAPVTAAIIIAYILDGGVTRLQRIKIPKAIAVWVVFIGFFAVLIISFFGLAPILFNQIRQFIQQMPNMLNVAQGYFLDLPVKYPQLIDEKQIKDIITSLGTEVANLGQKMITYSLNSILAFGTYVVYLILVPLMVFYFIKDKDKMASWFVSFLPEERTLVSRVWSDANVQFANYIRGKVWEIVIVGVVSYITFAIIGLNYSALLAVLTGFSVLIPFVGAAVVALPVIAVGFFQFGIGKDFTTVVIAYSVIQAIDGNILSTILFSEAVKIHPVAIVVAILVFGSLWGFWGVFFAIPLATLVQSIIKVWPSEKDNQI